MLKRLGSSQCGPLTNQGMEGTYSLRRRPQSAPQDQQLSQANLHIRAPAFRLLSEQRMIPSAKICRGACSLLYKTCHRTQILKKTLQHEQYKETMKSQVPKQSISALGGTQRQREKRDLMCSTQVTLPSLVLPWFLTAPQT